MAQYFWSNASLEPKRKFRWVFYFAGMPQFMIKTVKKPSFKVTTKAHDFMNYKFNFPGKVTWDPIDFTIIDPVNPDATHSFYSVLASAGYDLPSNFVTFEHFLFFEFRSI